MTGKYILSSYATWLKYVVQETVDYFVAMRIKKKLYIFHFWGVTLHLLNLKFQVIISIKYSVVFQKPAELCICIR